MQGRPDNGWRLVCMMMRGHHGTACKSPSLSEDREPHLRGPACGLYLSNVCGSPEQQREHPGWRLCERLP
jgi:hypothetical protein